MDCVSFNKIFFFKCFTRVILACCKKKEKEKRKKESAGGLKKKKKLKVPLHNHIFDVVVYVLPDFAVRTCVCVCVCAHHRV